MRGQFSVEFVIDVSFILIIVAFLIVFFASFVNTDPSVVTMNTMCNQISQGIDSASSSAGFSSTQYVSLINTTSQQFYNISVSNGIVIIELLGPNGKQPSLIANTNVVSCGADTRATANETFGLSNLVIYPNSSKIDLAYLYGNYSDDSAYPLTISGGGFSGNTSLYILYQNGTSSLLANYNPSEAASGFTYISLLKIETLPTGDYQFYAQEDLDNSIHVSLPFSKT